MHNLKFTAGLAASTLALVLSACGGGPDPTPQPTPQPTEQTGIIKGQITPWSTGWANKVFPVNAAIETPGAAFTANVNAAGQFDLALPNVTTMTTTYASDLRSLQDSFALCTNPSFVGAPADFKLAQINELQTDTGKAIMATSNGGTTFKQWWFANQDAQFTFKADDCFGLGPVNSPLTFKRGWNVIDATYLTNNGSTYTVSSAPDRINWTQRGTSTAQNIHGDFLRPWVKANSSAK